MNTVTDLAKKRVTKARTHLLLDHAFFGTLAIRLRTVYDETISTACTDGTEIRWNPHFVQTLTDPELLVVLAHEILHVTNGHTWRRDSRDPRAWNIAADKAVNCILRDCGFRLPAGAIFPPHDATGLSAEAYYQAPDANDPQSQNGSGAGASGLASAGASGKGKPDDGEDPGGCGGVSDAPGSPDEQHNQAAEWKIAVAQAALAAKQMGQLPASLERLVHEIVTPKICWTVLLRDFVERSARNDYNWSRPNRRYLSRGIILPSLISEELPETVIVIDTSGSIGEHELATFAAEASAVLGAYETTIRLVYCDAAVNQTETITRADLPMQLKAVGGGGTNFIPAFDWVEEQGITPACLIYLTDMYGTFPQNGPDYPVLWVSTTRDQKAPFGTTVELEVTK